VGFSNVDKEKIGDAFVFLEEFFNAPGVATERSSCVGAENQHDGSRADET
jgi:hypothetical protein